MAEKLMQNRIVIVGRSPKDAYDYSNTRRFRDSLESPYLMNSASHRLTILGGMPHHVGTVYVTSRAPEGEHYDVVLEAIEAAKKRNPNLRVVEELRTVDAL